MIELLFCLLPLCLGRMLETSVNQELGRNKIFLQNQNAAKRSLRPTLNIRNGPEEFLEVNMGDSKILECEAGGTPPPAIHWLKDGVKVPQNVYDTISSPGDMLESTLGLGFTRSRLFLDCISASDAGSYSCVAENEYIRVFKTSQVVVTDSTRANNDMMCLARKSFVLPARVSMWTHTRLEIMGTDVQLLCRTAGIPQPHVIWRGPSKKLLNDPKRYEVLPNGDLIIRKIKWSDMGGYTCQTKNSEGSDEATIFLYPTLPENEPEF